MPVCTSCLSMNFNAERSDHDGRLKPPDPSPCRASSVRSPAERCAGVCRCGTAGSSGYLFHVPVALIRRTQKISGCEQSTRWTHPGHGPRTAGRSLNLRCAGSWVFRSASGCTQGRFWIWSGVATQTVRVARGSSSTSSESRSSRSRRRRGRPRSGPPGARSGRTTAWAYSRAAGVTGAMAVTSDRVTPNPAASMTGVQSG